MSPDSQIVTGLAKIGLVLRSAQWRGAESAAMTPTQAQILVHLVRRGPTRIAAIAAEIAVTQPTASEAAAALVRKGHLERRPDPDDGRAALLHPTPSGRQVAGQFTLWPDALLAAVGALAPDEKAVFVKALTRMIRALQVDGAIPAQRMCATCRFFRPQVHDDPAAPHHCDYVGAPFAAGGLRLDCDEHAPAADPQAAAAWQRFAGAPDRERGPPW